MADSIREKVLIVGGKRLDRIARSDGYNTQPKLVATRADAFEAEETVCLWITEPTETFGGDSATINAAAPVALEIVVNALVRADRGSLSSLLNLALQDVRNALNANAVNYRTNTLAGWRGFDECNTDEGELSFKDMAIFTQPAVFEYHAGPTW